MGLIPWVYSKQKQASEGCKKTLQMGPKAFWGLFQSPLLDATLDIPQKLVGFGYPNGIALRCLINILPDFLLQFELVGLEGHTATNLYQIRQS